MGWAEGFAAGTQIGRGLIDTYQQGVQRKKQEDAIAADAQGRQEQTDTQSNFGTMDPNAVYSGEGSDGAMTNAEAASFGINVPKEDKAAGTGVTRKYGLGLNPQKWQDTPFTQDQKRVSGLTAQADFLSGQGDVEGASKIRGALRGERLEAREETRLDREERNLKREEDYQTGRQAAFAGTIYGQQVGKAAQEFANYSKAKEQYDKGVANGVPADMLGAPPTPPQRPAYSLADSLADQGALLAYDAKHNKLDTKAFGDFADKVRKVSEEGYVQALNLAQAGGSIQDVAKAFNASGQMKFDPSAVVSDQMVENAQGVPERVITIKDPDGSTHAINVMSQLQSLGKAQNALETFYAGEKNRQADKRLDLEETKILSDRRGSQFDTKEVDKYYAPPKDLTSYDDPNNPGKQIAIPGLHEAYTSEYMRRIDAGVSPARAGADTIAKVNQLRALAEQRVDAALKADKKSTLTVGQAVGQINAELRKAEQARQAAQPAPSNTTGRTSAAPGYQNEGAMRATAGGDMGANPEAAKREIARMTEDLRKVSDPSSKAMLEAEIKDLTRQLQRVGGSTATPPAGPAQAAATAAAPAAPVAPPLAVAAASNPPVAPANNAPAATKDVAPPRSFAELNKDVQRADLEVKALTEQLQGTARGAIGLTPRAELQAQLIKKSAERNELKRLAAEAERSAPIARVAPIPLSRFN